MYGGWGCEAGGGGSTAAGALASNASALILLTCTALLEVLLIYLPFSRLLRFNICVVAFAYSGLLLLRTAAFFFCVQRPSSFAYSGLLLLRTAAFFFCVQRPSSFAYSGLLLFWIRFIARLGSSLVLF